MNYIHPPKFDLVVYINDNEKYIYETVTTFRDRDSGFFIPSHITIRAILDPDNSVENRLSADRMGICDRYMLDNEGNLIDVFNKILSTTYSHYIIFALKGFNFYYGWMDTILDVYFSNFAIITQPGDIDDRDYSISDSFFIFARKSLHRRFPMLNTEYKVSCAPRELAGMTEAKVGAGRCWKRTRWSIGEELNDTRFDEKFYYNMLSDTYLWEEVRKPKIIKEFRSWNHLPSIKI